MIQAPAFSGLLGVTHVSGSRVRIGRERITTLVIEGGLTTPYTTSEGAAVLMPVMERILPLLEIFNSGE